MFGLCQMVNNTLGYSKVDVATWARKKHFEILSTVGSCTFSQTAQLDVTELLAYTKAEGLKFYPVMIHVIAKLVNRFPEFRMAMKDGELVLWDVVHPSYTIFHHSTETFSSLWTCYADDLSDFLQVYSDDREKYGGDHSYFPRDEYAENVFYVSANPWVSFTSFNFNVADASNFFAPMFTIGKYYSQGERIFMPLAVQVHHAVCDGFHVGRIINEIQKTCIAVNGS